MPDLNAADIVAFHDRSLDGSHPPHHPEGAIWHWIAENHRCNALLWREEDTARRTDVPDAVIVRCKRNIDLHNQRRNDAVEAIDDRLQAELNDVYPEPDVRMSSETAGAIIDRLSTLALRIHHMRIESARADADPGHREACAAKLARLTAQREDLAACFDRLLREARSGEACFPTYRQFKT